MFGRKDERLVKEFDVCERTIMARIAMYLQTEINNIECINDNIVVDCEYNRHFTNIKKMMCIKNKSSKDRIKQVRIFPDIIVHERGNDDNNILVVEIKICKTDNNDKIPSDKESAINSDKERLKYFTDKKYDYSYKRGVMLIIKFNGHEIKFENHLFEDGEFSRSYSFP